MRRLIALPVLLLAACNNDPTGLGRISDADAMVVRRISRGKPAPDYRTSNRREIQDLIEHAGRGTLVTGGKVCTCITTWQLDFHKGGLLLGTMYATDHCVTTPSGDRRMTTAFGATLVSKPGMPLEDFEEPPLRSK